MDQYGQDKPLYKEWNMICGFIAQFCYVGAQVTIATFFINYAHSNGGYTDAKASQMLSYALITFTVGRFIATAIATVGEYTYLTTTTTSILVLIFDNLTSGIHLYACGIFHHCNCFDSLRLRGSRTLFRPRLDRHLLFHGSKYVIDLFFLVENLC